MIELVHEALVREWETLRVWIDENRRQLLLNDELARRAEKWAEHGKPSRGLPSGHEMRELLEGNAIEQPIYDYTHHRRSKDTRRISDHVVVVPASGGTWWNGRLPEQRDTLVAYVDRLQGAFRPETTAARRKHRHHQ